MRRPVVVVEMGHIVLLDVLLRFAFGMCEWQIQKFLARKFWLHYSFKDDLHHVIGTVLTLDRQEFGGGRNYEIKSTGLDAGSIVNLT